MPKIRWKGESKLLNIQITTKEKLLQLDDKDDHSRLKKSSYMLYMTTEDMSKNTRMKWCWKVNDGKDIPGR